MINSKLRLSILTIRRKLCNDFQRETRIITWNCLKQKNIPQHWSYGWWGVRCVGRRIWPLFQVRSSFCTACKFPPSIPVVVDELEKIIYFTFVIVCDRDLLNSRLLIQDSRFAISRPSRPGWDTLENKPEHGTTVQWNRSCLMNIQNSNLS